MKFNLMARIYFAFALGLITLTWILTVLNKENFFKEGTFFTWITSIQIVALAFLSLQQVFHQNGEYFPWQKWGPASFWIVTALFFSYLAADEVFSLHEGGGWLKRVLERTLEINLSPFYAELILLSIYGLVGGFLIWQFFLIFRDKREVLNFLGVGAVLLILAFFFDHFLPKFLKLPVVFEDGFKLFGFSSLLLGFLRAYLVRFHSIIDFYTEREKVLWQILLKLSDGEKTRGVESFQNAQRKIKS